MSTSNHQSDALQRAALLANSTNSHLTVPAQSPYISGTSSQSGSDVSLHRVKNAPGYKTPVFSGKEKQRDQVEKDVAAVVRMLFLAGSEMKLSTFIT